MDLIVFIKIATIITDTNPFIWIIMLRHSTVSEVCLVSLRHGASSGCGWRRRPPGMGGISKQPGRAEKHWIVQLGDGITTISILPNVNTGPLDQQRSLENMALNLAFPVGRGISRSGQWVTVRFVISSWIDLTKTPWLLVRKRTIPTERPPLVDEVNAKFRG
jgi:hypothetical protein